LRVVAGREAFANANEGSGPLGAQIVWTYMCLRIIAFVFGLRSKELRTARLTDLCTDRTIVISFHPKGATTNPRITAHRWAFGVLGPFRWWAHFRVFMAGRPSICPRLNTASVLRATHYVDGFPKSDDIAKSVVPLATLAHWGAKRLDVPEARIVTPDAKRLGAGGTLVV